MENVLEWSEWVNGMDFSKVTDIDVSHLLCFPPALSHAHTQTQAHSLYHTHFLIRILYES